MSLVSAGLRLLRLLLRKPSDSALDSPHPECVGVAASAVFVLKESGVRYPAAGGESKHELGDDGNLGVNNFPPDARSSLWLARRRRTGA